MKSHILWVAFWVICLLQTPAWGSETSAAELDVKRQGHVGFTNRDSWPKGEAALTFDDGPHPSFTPKVLDLLAKHGMKATFFLVGQNITDKTYPLVQRMIREGHAIGSHSYSHDVKMALSESRDTVSYIRGQHEATQNPRRPSDAREFRCQLQRILCARLRAEGEPSPHPRRAFARLAQLRQTP
ncbi:MAG: polysaccharide deacetylase family protein [Polyangiaceae bacterium]